MKETYKIVFEGGQGEIVEKKSRFIATVAPIETEEEALAFIEKMKKKYWDARHNCYAYVLGQNQELMRFSDDNEPQGTAGKPMLDVLLGEGVHYTVVVVTRYFGGTLLGTGGLVRAYSGAVQAGLAASTLADKNCGVPLTIGTDYTGIGKVQYLLAQRKYIPYLLSIPIKYSWRYWFHFLRNRSWWRLWWKAPMEERRSQKEIPAGMWWWMEKC